MMENADQDTTEQTLKQGDDVPPFARSTASQSMKQTMKGAAMMENADQDTTEQTLKQGMAGHLDGLQAERLADPERYQAKHKTPSKMLRGPTRTVGSEPATMTQIKVKEVKVNRISDKSVAQLRAAKEAESRTAASAGGGMGPGGRSMDMDHVPVTSVLDECITAVLADDPIIDSFDS